ncbi:MAG: ABC transporter ATP-binding protein [Anaerolineales bacterium]|nr:ABC transporter ATP-binding protein [Anaerolineales bacterium]
MNTEDVVLRVSNLKKYFKIYPSAWGLVKEWLTFGRRSYHEDFWALKDMSFEIYKGEFVGVIGPNGAGKSTLLRIITDALQPTDGSYEVKGRVLSILELSGGTDKDLTGRENVVRSGQMLGFPDGYVQERMERIKEFSELGEFFDQPLRVYSTGMKTRLSFSMFAFMDTDILILDEVLAVGDIFFQVKCFARLAELIEKNTSIVLVTHSLGIVQRYCKRVILLNNGEKLFDGDPNTAVRMFMDLRGAQNAAAAQNVVSIDQNSDLANNWSVDKPKTDIRLEAWPPDEAFTLKSFPNLKGKGKINLTRMAVLNDQGQPALVFKQGDRLHLYVEFQLKKDIGMPIINFEIRDPYNLLIHSKSTIQDKTEAPRSVSHGNVVHYYQSVVLDLAPQNYVINLDCFSFSESDHYTELERQDFGSLVQHMFRLFRLDGAFAIVVTPRFDERMILPYGGLCDLSSETRFQITR